MIKQIAVAVFSLGLAFAQGPEGSPQERMDKLAKELNLTADQKAKLEPIFKEQAEKMRALRDENKGSRREMMKGMREIQEQNDAKISEVLTAEQKTKWDEIKKERVREFREGRKGRRP
ncbi:MAG: hypothetical protein SFV18_07185 [Bryobacteraceae bacterium]|nr:hypothetical protein [Bryobacteraceae bacterium]